MKTFYLKPIDSRKSFNNKCHVNEYTSEGTKYSDLTSYGTRVAYFNHNEGFISIQGWYSATTARHINAFLDYFGFDTMNKKEMQSKPILELNEA